MGVTRVEADPGLEGAYEVAAEDDGLSKPVADRRGGERENTAASASGASGEYLLRPPSPGLQDASEPRWSDDQEQEVLLDSGPGRAQRAVLGQDEEPEPRSPDNYNAGEVSELPQVVYQE